jgi:hypothetical protein
MRILKLYHDRVCRTAAICDRKGYILQDKEREMVCKLPIKPIKDNPLAAKLKEKKTRSIVKSKEKTTVSLNKNIN